MSDLVSRQAVKEWLAKWEGYIDADIIARMQYTIIDIPSAQPEPCEDAVSRQAVYNVLDKMPVRGFKKDGETIHGLISLSQVNSAIIDLPSAQPVAKDIDVPVKDCISRQAAIDALDKIFPADPMRNDYTQGIACGAALAKTYVEHVEQLPSAEPEPLTDKEQRIFLAAMGREEKVCKQVDDECRNCREPYEDSLVRTCHEITRKVKGALWET